MEDLSGQRFGKLTVIRFSHVSLRVYYWLCKCDCGKESTTRSYSLKKGISKTCGCSSTKHGLSNNPLYNTYQGMIIRCYNPKYPEFKYYGGRGITVCDEWKKDRATFFKWALENGYKHGLQNDRIDNDGNYEPGNCRFVTSKVNNSNRRVAIRKKHLQLQS